MSNTDNKGAEVRRLLAAGRELTEEQRRRLLQLQARMDSLWEQRESSEAQRYGGRVQGRAKPSLENPPDS
jgi:uncharacterized protein YeaC (DUF1315 family)